MIQLQSVSKTYRTRSGTHQVLDDCCMEIHLGQKVGILGLNGAGKSTLIRLISGAELPTSGYIKREMSVSWPLGYSGGFQGSLTGLDNVKFICRVYNANLKDVVEYVKDFAELGKFFFEPVKYYSSGMRARLAFAISMAIEFDCFLIDEVISAGDDRFREKCHIELFDKRRERAMIMVSHELHNIREYCSCVVVLHAAQIHLFENIDDAVEFYQKNAI